MDLPIPWTLLRMAIPPVRSGCSRAGPRVALGNLRIGHNCDAVLVIAGKVSWGHRERPGALKPNRYEQGFERIFINEHVYRCRNP